MKETATVVGAPSNVDGSAAAQAQGDSGFSRRVMHSFAWESGAQLSGQLISWAATIVVIRMLTPSDYGLMAMTMLLIGFFMVIADLGVGSAAVQAEEIDLDAFRAVLGLMIVTGVAFAAFTFLTAPLVARFFDEPRITLLSRIMSVNFLLMAFAGVPQAQLVRRMDFRTKGKVEIAANTTGALLSLTLALAGAGVWALVGGVLGQSLARAVGYQLVAPARISPIFSLDPLRSLIRFSATLSADRIVFFFYGSIDLAIAGKALGEEALGFYTAALAFSSAPIQRIIPAVTQVSFAAFARIQSDVERVRRNLIRTVRLASAFTFPTLLGLAAVAPVLLPVALGERWLGALIPFQIICIVLPLRSISAIQSAVLLGTGRVGLNLTNMVISFGLMSAAFAVGVRYGLLGLSMSWAIMFPLVFLITSARISRALQLPMRHWLSGPGLSPVFALVMYGAVLLVSYSLPDAMANLTQLVFLITTGVVVYGSLVFTADRRLIDDLRATLAR